jgi:hypothetical protein
VGGPGGTKKVCWYLCFAMMRLIGGKRSSTRVRNAASLSHRLLPPSSLQPSSQIRPFTSSPHALKKHTKANPSSSSSSSSAATAAPDPFDFSALSTAIQTALQKLQDDLASLRAGGRLNPATIEGLRVRVKGKAGGEAQAVRLGDLAQVVPRGGRGLVVQVLDPDVRLERIHDSQPNGSERS